MRARDVLETLTRRDLSREESTTAFHQLLAGEYSDIEMAGVLVALKTRGETPEIMAGAVEALLSSVLPFPRPDYRFADCCGTGGDGASTLNISTAAAFVAAELGIPMAKTGNRSVSSRCGSADVLEHLGVRLDPAPEVSRRCLDEVDICFVYAPQYHPGVGNAAPVRRALGVRTVFNLVGPMANAARPQWQMMGIYDRSSEGAARTLRSSDVRGPRAPRKRPRRSRRVTRPTTGVLLKDGKLRHITISPADAGLAEAPVSALGGAGPEENAALLTRLLEGRGTSAHADAVSINVGVLAWITGLASTLRQGTELARQALDGGGGARRLSRLAELSHLIRPATTMARDGIEPPTRGFSVRCSTN